MHFSTSLIQVLTWLVTVKCRGTQSLLSQESYCLSKAKWLLQSHGMCFFSSAAISYHHHFEKPRLISCMNSVPVSRLVKCQAMWQVVCGWLWCFDSTSFLSFAPSRISVSLFFSLSRHICLSSHTTLFSILQCCRCRRWSAGVYHWG